MFDVRRPAAVVRCEDEDDVARLSVCCETPMCPSRFVEAVATSQGSVRVRAGS